MKSFYRWFGLPAMFVCCAAAMSAAVVAPTVFLPPQPPTYMVLVAAKNGVAISPPSAAVIAAPGDDLTLEVWAKCWSNGYPLIEAGIPPLIGYQVAFDYCSFFNDATGDILPINFRTITDPNDTCGRNCTPGRSPIPPPPVNPSAAGVNTAHPSYVFKDRIAQTVTNTRLCDYVISAGVLPNQVAVIGLCPQIGAKYMGTLNVEVSADASGDFTLCLQDHDNLPITPDVTDPLDPRLSDRSLVSPAASWPIGPDVSYMVPFQTAEITGTRINYLKFECATVTVEVCPNPPCVPQQCVGSIASSVPPKNSIDARRPSEAADPTPIGTQLVDVNITFTSGDAACVSGNDNLSKWSVSTTGPTIPGQAPTPSVTSVSQIDPDTVRVSLSGPIPAGKWTRLQLTTDDGRAASSTCLGYLPANVDGNATSSPLDIIRIVDCLNGVQQCAIYQGDVNRSGSMNAQDILAVVDLLNGAGAFEPWAGVALPATPCN